ncbi:Imm21 family immunity protein [Kribbella sp. NPDC051718]|uniref:Imm21 family immunity protein n=1 Tax=Kribbella sp. NPDC051718 TaxID=3155168 RepID=UPI0034483BB6
MPAGEHDTAWVESMGGPLIVVPVSALGSWRGSTLHGTIAGDSSTVDDYDRACGVDELAGVIAVADHQALVLGDEPATTCYLAEYMAFVRWLGADSEAELFEAAKALIVGEDTDWTDCGVWTTDGPTVLMDSANAGADLGVPYVTGGVPSEAPVLLAAGQWRVSAVHVTGDVDPWVGVVRLSTV